ncbi:M48 family metallopeptidase [Microbacterium marinilacus]|nr:SprT family zinc-dependent metalloprotease [Microbacterium marinilacus]
MTAAYGAGTITFTLRRRPRTTLDIAVDDEGNVIVTAPEHAANEEVVRRVARHGRWITAQRQYFEQFRPRTPPRTWLPGETHLYLGRQYRLRVGNPDATHRRVRLIRGFLLVDGVRFGDADKTERLVHAWYRDRATEVFARRLHECLRRFDTAAVAPVSMRIREMSTRWGSMSPGGVLSLAPALVRAPSDAIDYVITHELAHRIEPHHGPAFWRVLAAAMPDYERRKTRLERALA